MSTTATSLTPAASRILVTATPAAPAPEITTRVVSISRPVSFRAFSRAASTTTAVPCWSSWKTGMSSSRLSRSSISKQRGAEMSSRLIPPKLGASRTTVSTISSGSWVSSVIGTASTPPNALNRTALPSITGIDARGPMLPRPEYGGAVGDDGDGVRHPCVLVVQGRVGGDRLAHPGDTRRVGHRQVVAPVERDRRADLHLAADVQVEHRVAGAWGVGGRVLVSHPCDGPTAGRGTAPLSHTLLVRAAGDAATPGRAPPRARRCRGSCRRSPSRCPRRGLSRSTHQPAPSRTVARLTARVPSGKRTTTTWPARGGTSYRTRRRSPARSVGSIERPWTRASPRRGTGSFHHLYGCSKGVIGRE